MRRRALGWAAFWTATTALFIAGDKGGWSLCSVIRWLFDTKTPQGRRRFTLTFGTGAVALWAHIVKADGTLKET